MGAYLRLSADSIGGVFTTFGKNMLPVWGEMQGSGAASSYGAPKRTASSEPFNEPKKRHREGEAADKSGRQTERFSDELMRG